MIQDKNISYCNEFVYALVMELGGDYDSPPEADVPGGILAMDIGTIKGLSASKGYFPDRTEFTWSAEGLFDKYLLKRRIYGSGDNFVQIATVPGSATTGDIQTDDTKGIPGIYYEYMVVGAVNCGNVTRYSKDTLRSEEHTSELQSLMRISYAVFCLKKKKNNTINKYAETI